MAPAEGAAELWRRQPPLPPPPSLPSLEPHPIGLGKGKFLRLKSSRWKVWGWDTWAFGRVCRHDRDWRGLQGLGEPGAAGEWSQAWGGDVGRRTRDPDLGPEGPAPAVRVTPFLGRLGCAYRDPALQASSPPPADQEARPMPPPLASGSSPSLSFSLFPLCWLLPCPQPSNAIFFRK